VTVRERFAPRAATGEVTVTPAFAFLTFGLRASLDGHPEWAERLVAVDLLCRGRIRAAAILLGLPYDGLPISVSMPSPAAPEFDAEMRTLITLLKRSRP
jgi:hypothetical protein